MLTPSPSLTAALKLWAKMTLENENLQGDGCRLLKDLLAIHAPHVDLSDLLEKVKPVAMRDLIQAVSCYEDRFFIAMNAFAAAVLTGEPATQHFGALVDAFALREDDVVLLKNTVENRPNAVLEPRVESLYAGSSFYLAA